MKKNLKQARSDAGITQADIAKRMGVTYQMVYQWEKGIAPIARKHWKGLSSLLHVNETELEQILVQTLLDFCIATKDSRALLNAQTSRLYRSELLQDAFQQFNAYRSSPQPHSNEQTTELREQILKLREENLKLRETIIELRERCATPYRVSASTHSQYTSTIEESEVKK